MQKTTTSYLSFEEELLVAVYHNNVEKVKWLIGMNYFKPSMITDPMDFGEVSIPLYWLTICYHYMLRYEEYDGVRKSVDDMLALWKERFHLDTDEIVDFKNSYKVDKMPPIIKDDDKWWVGRLTLEDFLKSGAREVDYNLYKAVNAYDVKEVVRQLQLGGIPDAKVIDKNGNIRSTISMFRFGKQNRDYYLWGEEKVVERWKVGSLIREGLEEMILFLLEKSIRERESCQVATFSGNVDLFDYISNHNYVPSDEVVEMIDSFIMDIDKPGAVLTIFDEGKAFVRCHHLNYENLYEYLIKQVFQKSKYIVIRVGGYSYRVANMVLYRVKQLPEDRVYVEYLSEGSAEEEWKERDPRVRIVGMGKYKFTSDMAIVKDALNYDFKTFGNHNGSHTMVYYYVNNIDTGWYDEGGKFFPFYNKDRGLQAISDVVMIKGFMDIAPATAAVCTFTFDSGGDIIIAGSSIHKDKLSRTSSQRKLIYDAGIKLLDLTDKKCHVIQGLMEIKTISSPPKTICIDFDGVIHDYSKGWQGIDVFDKVLPGASEATHQLHEAGYMIIIYTTRNDTPALREFLSKNNIYFDYINYNPYQPKGSELGKVKADIYLDDRGVCFTGNWDEALHKIFRFKTWQQK